MGKYDDIIDLPHHVSTTHHRMSMLERAAQFQPFRALTGYEAALGETARLTEDRIELTEDEKALLDTKLQKLANQIAGHPLVTITFFQPDKKKTGGAYVCVTGQLKKIADYESALVLVGDTRISIDDIVDIQSI